MADDATPDPEAPPPRAAFSARRDPPVIDGEASEIHGAVPETPSGPDAPRAPEPSAEPRAKGNSFVYAAVGFGGAVVGIGVALGGAWYLDPRAGTVRELGAQSSALGDGLAKQAASTKALEARLAAIESGQAGLAKASALDALDKRVVKLESTALKPDALAAAQSDARAARDDAAKALALATAVSAAKPAAAPTPPAVAAAPDPGSASSNRRWRR